MTTTLKTNQIEMDVLIQRYLKHLLNSVSQSTKDNYEIDLKILQEYMELNNLSITEIETEHLEDYSVYLQDVKNYAESTQSRKIQLVKYFFEYLKKIKYISENPATTLKLPKLPERNPVYLDLKEAKKFIGVINKEKNEYLRSRNNAIALILLNHGLRVAELTDMKLSNINGKTLSIIGKGNKERQIILTDDTITAINEYLQVRYDIDTDYLFLSERRKPINKRSVQLMITNYLEKAGLEGYSVHKLRHTAATIMSDKGVETSDIQEILGHADISTTKIYTHTTTTKKEQIAEKMNGLFTN